VLKSKDHWGGSNLSYHQFEGDFDAWFMETAEREKGTLKSYSTHSQQPPPPSLFLLTLPFSIGLSHCFL